jgi:hypothetical protein
MAGGTARNVQLAPGATRAVPPILHWLDSLRDNWPTEGEDATRSRGGRLVGCVSSPLRKPNAVLHSFVRVERRNVREQGEVTVAQVLEVARLRW